MHLKIKELNDLISGQTSHESLSDINQFEDDRLESDWESWGEGCRSSDVIADIAHPLVQTMPVSDYLIATSFFIFLRARQPEDWCIQSVSVGSSIWFGGLNRIGFVSFDNDSHWIASPRHCTVNFLNNIERHCPWVVVPGSRYSNFNGETND